MFVLKSRFDKLQKNLNDANVSVSYWAGEAKMLRDILNAERDKPPMQVERIKLAPHMYDILMKNTLGAGVPKDELEAGFRLGVEYLAKKLREGFVV